MRTQSAKHALGLGEPSQQLERAASVRQRPGVLLVLSGAEHAAVGLGGLSGQRLRGHGIALAR